MLYRQKGATTVEFAIIGLLFFIILFGIVEMGRALFVWNGLADITRRAARIAAVCPPNDTSVIRTAIYNAAGNDGSSRIYTHQMLIPTFNINLTPPDFSTTVPAESLGRWEDAAGNVYNGCYLP